MRFCGFCNEVLWPEAPDDMVVKRNTPYCDETCEKRHRLVTRRENRDYPNWTHDCPSCDRPMFTPAWENGCVRQSLIAIGAITLACNERQAI